MGRLQRVGERERKGAGEEKSILRIQWGECSNLSLSSSSLSVRRHLLAGGVLVVCCWSFTPRLREEEERRRQREREVRKKKKSLPEIAVMLPKEEAGVASLSPLSLSLSLPPSLDAMS